MIKLNVHFFASPNGAEPVRDWLRSLEPNIRTRIGRAITRTAHGWPVGMPVCRALGGGLFEVRCDVDSNIYRVIFEIIDGDMILLHGFEKKTQKTNQHDLVLAKDRQSNHQARKRGKS